jgi:hypothetical protein
MDPQTIGLADSTLQILKSAASIAGSYTATFNSDTFDMAQGATLVNGQYAPGAGGAALQVPVPVTAWNASQTLTITATGGTFTFSLNTSAGVQTTGAVAFGASAATIATAINGLAAVTATGAAATVTGGGPFTVTLPPALQVYGNQANPLTLGTGSLTGGTATLVMPTYTFTVNESSDGATWRAASPARNVAQDGILPTGDGFLMLMTQSRQRYLQLACTITGTGPSITIGPVYIQPFVNKFGG